MKIVYKSGTDSGARIRHQFSGQKVEGPKDIVLTSARPGGRVPSGRTTWENWFHFLTPKLVPFSSTETGATF